MKRRNFKIVCIIIAVFMLASLSTSVFAADQETAALVEGIANAVCTECTHDEIGAEYAAIEEEGLGCLIGLHNWSNWSYGSTEYKCDKHYVNCKRLDYRKRICWDCDAYQTETLAFVDLIPH